MDLQRQFQKADLSVEVLKEPLRRGRGMDEIFQIEVRRRFKQNARTEYFAIYTGAQGNEVSVISVDKDLRQLVLRVREPRRAFETTVRQWENRPTVLRTPGVDDKGVPEWVKQAAIERKAEIINWNESSVTLREYTSEAVRYFLMGVDERQLFIAQTRDPVGSVKAARESLGKTVQFAEGKSRITRQGEWFFIEISAELNAELTSKASKNAIVVHTNVPIGASFDNRGGNPHVASQLIRVPGEKLEHGFAVRGQQVYIRGSVRHKDHKTVSFKNWRLVVANNEAHETARGTASGVNWID